MSVVKKIRAKQLKIKNGTLQKGLRTKEPYQTVKGEKLDLTQRTVTVPTKRHQTGENEK